MLGAQHVIGVDVDEDALRTAQQNVDEYEDRLPVRRQRRTLLLGVRLAMLAVLAGCSAYVCIAGLPHLSHRPPIKLLPVLPLHVRTDRLCMV